MYAFSSLSGAAVLLALTPSVLAIGTASVYNNCDMPVYYKTITTADKSFQLIPAGGVHEPYANVKQKTGVSIKLTPNPINQGPVSQFEYTWADGKIAYDLSNIDGYPFAQGGMIVKPSANNATGFPTCVPVDCPAGPTVCHAAYNLPDDVRTLVCNENANLVLTLCPGAGSEKRSIDIHQHRDIHRRQPRHPHARPE